MPGPERQVDAIEYPDGDDGAPRGPGLGSWVILVIDAARRRWIVTALVFLAGMLSVTAYAKLKTPLYRVEARLLAQGRAALPSVVRQSYEENPTRSAWETIHRRENLIALAQQTGLLSGPGARHGIAGSLSALVRRGAKPQEIPLDTMVQILDKRILVTVEEGTITVSLDWPDPDQAYAVVQAALQNFLEARHVQEVKAIDEVMSVLQGRLSVLREEYDSAVEDARRRPVRILRPAAPRPRQPSEELTRVRSLLEAKTRAIQDVEEIRRRRLADLQSQLDQARNTLSDAHPTVIGLRKDIEAASQESPQIEALRDEERKLRKEYSDRAAREGIAPGQLGPSAAPLVTPEPPEEDDQRLRQKRSEYEQMLGRVNAAQVELDAARAAFKYRYNVIWPPQRPTEPVSPNPKKVFGLGGLASLLLALLAGVAPDLWSRRIVQRWQVERSLRLPVLGEVKLRR